MSTTAIYLRVSTTDKGQETDMQLSACKAWLRSNGKDENDYRVFEDKMSGRKSNRPAYQQMISAAERGEIKLIMAYKLDRIARSLQELLVFSNRLKAAKTDLIIATQPELNGGSKSALSNMMFQLLGVFAEFESNLISERIRSGIEEGKRRGVSYGGDKNSILRRVAILAAELKPNPRTGRRWSLLKIREKMKLPRESFYAAVEFLERERNEFITDYSDERYIAQCRGFRQKRVDKKGNYLSSQDPKLTGELKQKEQAVDLDVSNLEKYVEKLESNESIESTVNYILRDAPTRPAETIKFKIKPRVETASG